MNQIISGHSVVVKRHKISGSRVLLIDSKNYLPAEIAQLCVGKDAWVGNVVVKCKECGVKFKLKDSDSPLYCNEHFYSD